MIFSERLNIAKEFAKWAGDNNIASSNANFLIFLGNMNLLVPEDKSEFSDGYHTFDELYNHRHMIFGLVCKQYNGWKSCKHHDGSEYEGWFIAGCVINGKQVTYHLPNSLFSSFPVEEIDKAPEWDGHTSKDVITRLYEGWKK